MPRSHFDDKQSFDENRKRISHAALEYFTNRVRSIDAFVALVNAQSGSPLQLLSFCGLGGIGKTALLAKLAQELDKNPARFHNHKLPHARFDFKGSPVDASVPALLALRVGLGHNKGIAFPRFDPMVAMLIARSGAEAPPLVKINPKLGAFYQISKDASSAASLIPVVGPLAATMATAMALVESAGKWAGKKAAEHSDTAQNLIRKAGGTDADIKLFEQVQAGGPELQDELIRRFALDLKESLDKAPLNRAGFACRAVIFLDTYEQLGIGGTSKDSARASELETWVRRLVADCLAIGVLPVIAGRDHLRERWHEKEPDENWPGAIDEHHLGGLSRRDAQHFLHACGIGEPPDKADAPENLSELQRAIIDCCPEYKDPDAPTPKITDDDAEKGCHPLALALCAEIVLNTRADPTKGTDPAPETFRHIPPGKKRTELTDRFLNSLNDTDKERWLAELSLTPRFDADAALEMAKARRRDQNRTAWEVLTLYSFMEKQADGFWRVHSLMADCLSRRVNESDTRAVHEFFRDYWQQRGEAALAFYHQWALAPEGTLQSWFEQHEAARKDIKRIADARQLLTLWDEIALDDADRQIGDELWAQTHFTIANALQETPCLGIGAAHTASIEHYQAALEVYSEDALPQDWALTQNNLGIVFSNLPSGDRTHNLQRAIMCYKAALRIRTEVNFPQEWAMIQNNLGVTHNNIPTGDHVTNCKQAITHFKSALRVHTEDDFPHDWAKVQNNLGEAYRNLPTGNHTENLKHAIKCYRAALRVWTETDFPNGWAGVQNNLGEAYRQLINDERPLNLQSAIECYQAALRVWTEDDFPQDWALTQNNLGIAYTALHSNDQALTCFKAALRIWTEVEFPHDWAKTQNNIGEAFRQMPIDHLTTNIQQAIQYYQAALRVFTENEFPQDWAMTQNNLGVSYINLPSGKRIDNLQGAITFFKSALRVRTEDALPQLWAETQSNMGLTYLALLQENQELTALTAAYECFVNARRGFEAVGILEYAARANEMVERIEAYVAEIAAAQEQTDENSDETSGEA